MFLSSLTLILTPSPTPFPLSLLQLYLYFVNVNPLVTKPGDLALTIFIDDVALISGLDVVTTMGLPGQGNVTTIILQFSTAGYFATTIDIKASQPSRVRAPFITGLELFEVFHGTAPVPSSECEESRNRWEG